MVLRPLDKVESRSLGSLSCWAVTLPEQPPCLSAPAASAQGPAGWAKSSKARRLSSPDTRSLWYPSQPHRPQAPAGHQAPSLCPLIPNRSLSRCCLQWNVIACTGHSPDKQARAKSSPSAARAGLHLRGQAASSRPRRTQTQVFLLRRPWGFCCSWRLWRDAGFWPPSQVHCVGASEPCF